MPEPAAPDAIRSLVTGIHHVGHAVEDLEAAVERYVHLFGAEIASRDESEADGVAEVMLAFGSQHVQLLEATAPDTPVGRFLAKRGPGLHHVALAVDDIDAVLAHLRDTGARLIDERPRIGSGGHRIAFVHPATTEGVLIELVESAPGQV
jgi:methylmalonyl-CoA/ethylmalonyl-CoA epimerase